VNSGEGYSRAGSPVLSRQLRHSSQLHVDHGDPMSKGGMGQVASDHGSMRDHGMLPHAGRVHAEVGRAVGISGGVGSSSEVGHVEVEQQMVASYVVVGNGAVENTAHGDVVGTGSSIGRQKRLSSAIAQRGGYAEGRVVGCAGGPRAGSPSLPHVGGDGENFVGPSPTAAPLLPQVLWQEKGADGVPCQEEDDAKVTQMDCSLLAPPWL
jgi:hypothetical protein